MEDEIMLGMMSNIHKHCDEYNIVLVGDAMSGYEYLPVPKYTPNEVERMYCETANITRMTLLESPTVTIRAYHQWLRENVHYTVYEYQMMVIA